MWFLKNEALITALFTYLKERSLAKKAFDFILVSALFTWMATVYMVATNFTAIKQVFTQDNVDMKSLIMLDKSINDELERLSVFLSADRTSLSRFHNTVKDVQGKHFVFNTRTNEVVRPGVSIASPLRQNILLSMIVPWAQEFANNKCVIVTNLSYTDIFFDYYKQIGVKSDIKCPVYNIEGNLIGFVSAEFTTRMLSAGELRNLEKSVRDSSGKIGAILSVKVE